jgi:hypothetical protein
MKSASLMAGQASISIGTTIPGRASITHAMNSEEAACKAKALAKTEQENLELENPT